MAPLSLLSQRPRLSRAEISHFDLYTIPSGHVDRRASAALLYYAGYLTIADAGRYSLSLDFPNAEVRTSMLALLLRSYTRESEHPMTIVEDVLEAAEKADLASVVCSLNERALAAIDAETDKMISGIAVHWYSGDHFETLEMIHERFPDKKILFSEACIEYYKFNPADVLQSAQKYAHDIIGNLNSGMTSFYDWNLVLDAAGGPNHVRNYCDAPFMYDLENGVMVKRNAASYIWHFSHFLQPGAVRIGKSVYISKLEVTAFKNPDGEIAAVVLNRTKEDLKAVIRVSGKAGEIDVPADSITPLTI